MPQRNSRDKKETEFPSLDLIFELTRERIANQNEQMNALDSKANFVLGSATALVSTALVLQAVVLTQQSSQATPHLYCPLPKSNLTQVIPLSILLLVYLCVLFTAYLAYRIRVYKQVPDLDELYNTYLIKEESKTKAEVFEAMRFSYNQNDNTIRHKVTWLKIAFILLECEAVALVANLFLQTMC